MKLAVLHGPGELRLEEVARPVASACDVVVKVRAAGICGSDIGFLAVGSPTGGPMALGHELAGVVTEAGDAVTQFRVGDRVVLNPLVNLIGNGGPEGGFAPFLLVRDVAANPESLIHLPDEVSFEEGALVEPLAVSFHAVDRANLKPGAKVAIFGAGPIGLGIVIALRRKGIDDLVVFDPSRLRRDRAHALGAKAALNPLADTPADELQRLHGAELFCGFLPVAATDVYFDAAGAAGLLPAIIGHAKQGSNIVLAAVYKRPETLDLQAVVGKEISIISSLGYGGHLRSLLDDMSELAPAARQISTHVLPFADILEAFDLARDPEVSSKVLLRFDAA